jgi:hypothetical protein
LAPDWHPTVLGAERGLDCGRCFAAALSEQVRVDAQGDVRLCVANAADDRR